jgi:hypothetical protein
MLRQCSTVFYKPAVTICIPFNIRDNTDGEDTKRKYNNDICSRKGLTEFSSCIKYNEILLPSTFQVFKDSFILFLNSGHVYEYFHFLVNTVQLSLNSGSRYLESVHLT